MTVVPENVEEGYKSTTNNDKVITIDDNEELLKPVLRMSFSKDLTKEEADANWNAEVNKFITQQKLEEPQIVERRVSTEFYFGIGTRTGSQTDNDTDADYVFGRLYYNCDKGNFRTKWYDLVMRRK